MTGFFDTAVGKTVKVGLWLGGSYLASYLLSFVGSHHFSGVYTILPGVINIAAYGFNTIKDVEVPNLPSSPLMQVVPLIEQAEEQNKTIAASEDQHLSVPATPPVAPPTNPAI